MFFKLYFKWAFFLLLWSTIISCGIRENDNSNSTALEQDLFTKDTIQYAQHFGIMRSKNSTIIFITENFKDTVFFKFNRHFQKLAIMGTIPVFQLYLLNGMNNLVAIDDIKYYNNEQVHKLFLKDSVKEIMPNLQWHYEKLLAIHPDILITYSAISDNQKLQNILQQHAIQHLIYLDYLEQHPLGRAEWIKVIGALVGKETQAKKIFLDIEKKYLSLCKLGDTARIKPTVFTEAMYGDVWYIAGKRSYIKQLIEDAGGKYIFDFHDYDNARPYSLEYVLKYAKDADFWIHLQHFRSYKELKTTNSKYALFKPFQNKTCFNNNKKMNEYGYNDYYESGICLPHLILEDLIRILHSNYLPTHQLQYYQSLFE